MQSLAHQLLQPNAPLATLLQRESIFSLVDDSPEEFTTILLPTCLSLIATRVPERPVVLEVLSLLLTSSAFDTLKSSTTLPVISACIEAIAIIFDTHPSKAVVCLASTYPVMFKYLCSLPQADPKYWQILSLLKQRIDQGFDNGPESFRYASVLFLSQMIIAQSGLMDEEGVACLEMVPSVHPFMKRPHLALEASAVLNRFLLFLSDIDTKPCTPSFLTSVLNATFGIIKCRKEYALALTTLLVGLKEKPMSFLSSFGRRSVNRTLKVVLLNCYALPPNEPLEEPMEQMLKEFGVKTRDLLLKLKVRKELRENPSQGRTVRRVLVERSQVVGGQGAAFSVGTRNVPQADLGAVADELVLGAEILARGVHTMRLDLVVDAIMTSISMRDEMLLQGDIERFLLTGGYFDPTYRAPGRQPIQGDMSKLEHDQQVPQEEEMDEAEQEVDIDIDAILNSVTDLSLEEGKESVKQCFGRMLAMETFFPLVGKKDVVLAKGGNKDSVVSSRNGWMLVVVRLVSRVPNLDLQQDLVDWCMLEFGKRMDILLFWLFEEWARGQYDRCLRLVLESVRKLEAKDRLYTRFLVEVPQLTRDALDHVYDYCKDETGERMPLGIATLRDLCIYRPAVREQCLAWLFEFSESLGIKKEETGNLDCRLRDHSCNALTRFVNHDTIGPLVLETATKNAQTLWEEKERTDDDVLAKIALFLSLCLAKPALIPRLFEWFPKFGKGRVFDILSHACGNVVFPRVPTDSIIELVASFPAGSEDLALVLIKTLLKKEDVMQDVIEKTRVTFIDRNLDVRFLLLIITYLDKDNVLKHLGKIVSSLEDGNETQQAIVKKLFVDLTEVKQGINDEAPKSVVTPAELLIALHTLEDSIGLKKALAATNICFSMPEIFKQEVLAIVLSQLSERARLPTLFMRSVIQSLNVFKGLSGFTNQLLTKLIGKQVWKQKKLWDGFVRIVNMNFPSSMSILLTLKKPQAIDVLVRSRKEKKESEKHLGEKLEEYLENVADRDRSRREYGLLVNLVKDSKHAQLSQAVSRH
ncbi:hypothetical protein HDV03_002345 [Kappamyces sp. JEL0829]|nr:hypothetical protein HDV03_002345 [Kappamyces sp. JEL0829]